MTWWSTVTWDVARAGGVTAYALLTLSVLLGLALSLRWQRPQWPRLITNELHRFLTLLSLVFVAIHVAAVSIDPFTRFGWREIVIPLTSHYRPLWMGLGIVALYLFVAIWISTLVRARIGYAWWRRLHALTFVVYALATVHGIATGSDTRTAWALGMYAGGALLVGGLMTWRFLTPIGTRGQPHPWLAALTTSAVVLGALWTIVGPARAGWKTWANNRKGTGGRSVVAAPERQQSTGLSRPFMAVLQGTLTQSGPDASGSVTLRRAANLDDGTKRWLVVMVQGEAGDDG